MSWRGGPIEVINQNGVEMVMFLQKAIEPISWRLRPTVHLIPMKTSKVESALGKNLLCKVSQDYLYKDF